MNGLKIKDSEMKPTREQVIAWAREASNGILSYDAEGEWRLSQKEVERFAILAYEAGRAAENEACIRDCNGIDLIGADDCAAAIRARREYG